MSETILDFCTVCGTPSAVHVPGGLFCLQKQLAAEKAMRHDAMIAYAKLDAGWRVEKALREAAEARAAGLERERIRLLCTSRVHDLEHAIQGIKANSYLDDDVINRHQFTTTGCEALRNAFALLAPAPEQEGGGDAR